MVDRIGRALLPGLALAQEAPREVSIPSGDAAVSARLLQGVGEGARPAVELFNGFPAGPNIPRVAFDLQKAGYSVLLPKYRGTGTSGGTISLQHSREDGAAAVAWLKTDPASGADASKIGVIGVSYGGWVALQTAAADHGVRCAVALVPADMGVIGARWGTDADYRAAWKADLDSFAAEPETARFGPEGVDGFMNASRATPPRPAWPSARPTWRIVRSSSPADERIRPRRLQITMRLWLRPCAWPRRRSRLSSSTADTIPPKPRPQRRASSKGPASGDRLSPN